jgi:type I restriction-modification system DNA methylase subunit
MTSGISLINMFWSLCNENTIIYIKILTSLYETHYDVNKYIEFADFCAGTSQAAIKINEIRKENEVKNKFSYYGNEINSEACAISRILMVLNQIENSEIVNHDLPCR